jgi:hypothetical protein
VEHVCDGRTFICLSERLRVAVPELLNAFEAAPHGAGTGFQEARLQKLYESIPPGDFSRQVLSACTDMLQVLPMDDAGWNDLGTPARVMESVENGPIRRLPFPKRIMHTNNGTKELPSLGDVSAGPAGSHWSQSGDAQRRAGVLTL